MKFKIYSKFKTTTDQKRAVSELAGGLKNNLPMQTLLGVTGSGKTFTMANLIARAQRPTLIISHNKTLAAQLAAEFRDFFPKNAVCYFVSYYDYYQPEAYIPRTDTYIEKETDINEEIDRLRNAATYNLLTRRDVVIVASVSCIYGLGNPKDYQGVSVELKTGQLLERGYLLEMLTDLRYERNDVEMKRGIFRVRGEVLEIVPAYEDKIIKIEFNENKVERISSADSVTGKTLEKMQKVQLFPAKHFITPEQNLELAMNQIRRDLILRVNELKKQNKLLEAQRLEQRTNYDLEMIRETGYCNGIENYSRYFDKRKAGEPPYTLLDYFPKDFLTIIDESHITIPQIYGMYEGDRSRKNTLVEYGFRLPAARDNRPLKFDEFLKKNRQMVFASATPGPYEKLHSKKIVEQLVRPTGLLDPKIEIKPTKNQIDDLLNRIQQRVRAKERVLVTTLTKRLAEDLAEYLNEAGVKVHYLHSEIDTFQRLEILRDLRKGVYDVIVGINLLREGLDLPEVSLVAILDADKEGYLRSETSLVQTIGRAARHEHGCVVMYADKITGSMRRAIDETNRRRKIQEAYNKKYNIKPTSIKKEIREDRLSGGKTEEAVTAEKIDFKKLPEDELNFLVGRMESQMELAAKNLEFEKAASLRDQIRDIRQTQKEKKRKRH